MLEDRCDRRQHSGSVCPAVARRALTAANLVADFGLASECGGEILGALARALGGQLHAAAGRAGGAVRTRFEEWLSLLGPAGERTSKAAEHALRELPFAVDAPQAVRIPAARFVLHTYHALLVKLLAAEVLSAHGRSTSRHFARSAAASGDAALRRTLGGAIEGGTLFAEAGIDSFVEGTAFAWYLGAGTDRATRQAMMGAVRSVLVRLARYQMDELTAARCTDVLRGFYQALVPDVLRRQLGEFYTPDWLVCFTLDRAGTIDWPRVRALDPTCGSGSFLLEMIRRKREAARTAGTSDASLLRDLVDSIWGFDLNPLAVQAARANYLLAVLDLLGPGVRVALPVFRADAIVPPTGPPTAAAGRFDLVAGNPPWVRWSRLPAAYRQRVGPACACYGILSDTPYHGGNELDLSGIITYAAADRWLRDGGTLAFVLTQPHFQSPSSAGFRRFRVDGGRLLPLAVDDLRAIQPFPGAANKTAVAVFRKATNAEPRFPVPYVVWMRRAGRRSGPTPEQPLDAALRSLRATPMEAHAVAGEGSPWAVLAPGRWEEVRRLAGPSTFERGRKGITTDLNGVYFVNVVGADGPRGLVQVATRPEAGDRDIGAARTFWVEPALLYPLVKGAGDFSACRLHRDHGLFVFVPNRGITRDAYAEAAAILGDLPGTRAYFAAFEAPLRHRSTYRGRQRSAPYQAVYDVGAYTFAPWKVLWAEQGGFRAAAAGAGDVPLVGPRPFVPDHKVFFADFDDPAPAYYLCGLLNCPLVVEFVEAHTIPTQRGNIFKHLQLPPYVPADAKHAALVRAVEAAHREQDDERHASILEEVRVQGREILGGA